MTTITRPANWDYVFMGSTTFDCKACGTSTPANAHFYCVNCGVDYFASMRMA